MWYTFNFLFSLLLAVLFLPAVGDALLACRWRCSFCSASGGLGASGFRGPKPSRLKAFKVLCLKSLGPWRPQACETIDMTGLETKRSLALKGMRGIGLSGTFGRRFKPQWPWAICNRGLRSVGPWASEGSSLRGLEPWKPCAVNALGVRDLRPSGPNASGRKKGDENKSGGVLAPARYFLLQ